MLRRFRHNRSGFADTEFIAAPRLLPMGRNHTESTLTYFDVLDAGP